MLSLALKDRYTPKQHWQSSEWSLHCWKLSLRLKGRYTPPPVWNCQSSEWTLCFSMQSMRANSKQSSNRKIKGNVSVTPQLIGRYNKMSVSHQVHLMIYPPYIWQSTEWSLHCSMLSLALTDRYTPKQHWQTIEWSLHCWKLSLRLKGRYTPVFETARAQSDLFAFQCSQWEQIWNSQVIGRYKEMSVWHLN